MTTTNPKSEVKHDETPEQDRYEADRVIQASSPRRRRLTLPLFSLAHTPALNIEVTGQFRRASMPGLSKNDDGMVTLLPCIDLDTGEEGLLLSYTVVESAITRSADDYVGRSYSIVRGAIAPGKAYYAVEVYELLDGPA